MIEITKVEFASSVNIGKDNFEAKSIDTERKEFRHYKMVLDYNKGALIILNNDKNLDKPHLERKKTVIVFMTNIKFVMPKNYKDVLAIVSPKKGK